jgi:putative membrane protein
MASELDPPIEATLIPSLAEPRWLHPSSIFFGLLTTLRQFAFAVIFALFMAGTGSYFAMWGAGVVVLITACAASFRYLTLRYCLVDGELRIDEGLIFRRHRVIPASKIQNIDLLQNPLHHWLKVAEVRIETAGGSEPEAKLRVLSLEDVDRLRAAVFAKPILAAGHSRSAELAADQSNDATEDGLRDHSATVVHQIPVAHLVQAGLVSNRGFLLIPVAFGFFYQFDFPQRFDWDRLSRFLPQDLSTVQAVWAAILGSLVLLLGLRIFSVFWFLTRFYGYSLQRDGDDLRVSCGMFTRVSATVPRRRIQFISVHQTWLGRLFGLATIRIETAGSVGEKSEDAAATIGRKWFLPVVKRDQIDAVIAQLRTGLVIDQSAYQWRSTSPRTLRRLSRVALVQSIIAAAIGAAIYWPWGVGVGIPAFAILFYFARRYSRSLKYSRGDGLVIFRSGILTRKLSVTFFDKVQTVAVLQSPFDRRWEMATLLVDTAAAGPAQHRIEVKYLPTEVAFEESVQIASAASRSRFTVSS